MPVYYIWGINVGKSLAEDRQTLTRIMISGCFGGDA